MIVVVFLLYPLLIHALQERHYLQYKFTAFSKADSSSEFSAVGVCDDRQISHYSNEERIWILTEEEQTKTPPEPPDSREWFIHQMKTLSNCADSQCSELHIFQRIIGCELERFPNGSESLTAFDEYGFDGEDFISFNTDTMGWIEKNPKAKETKKKWDQQTGRNRFITKFITNFLKNCGDWISAFNDRYKSEPKIHFTARKDPADRYKLVLSCLATGFYPRDIEMYITTNHYNINPEDQESSGIRPNGDGSFQMRKSVKIERNHKNEEHYKCVVSHSSRDPCITVDLDVQCIDCEVDYTWIYIGGIIAVVVFVVLALCGWFIYKKTHNFAPVRDNDEGSYQTTYSRS